MERLEKKAVYPNNHPYRRGRPVFLHTLLRFESSTSIDCHGSNIRHTHSQPEGETRCDQKIKRKASVCWFQKFKRRHPETALRNPASVDMGRVSMSSESVVEDHFKKLAGLLQEISPECIWNVSEVGFGQVLIQLLFVPDKSSLFLVYQTWVAN